MIFKAGKLPLYSLCFSRLFQFFTGNSYQLHSSHFFFRIGRHFGKIFISICCANFGMKTAHIAQTVSRGKKASEGNQTETNVEVCENKNPLNNFDFLP